MLREMFVYCGILEDAQDILNDALLELLIFGDYPGTVEWMSDL